MPDDDKLPPADELEELEPLDPPDDNPEPGDNPPGDDEPSDDDNEPEPQPDDEPGARRARGQPDDRQRDRRRTREEEFQREVDRAVGRRLNQQSTPRQTVDHAEQQRQFQQRRNQEIEQARLEGSDKYAEVLSRHNREDMDARTNFFQVQQQDDRNQRDFDRLCARNSVYDNIRDDVEEQVQKLRAGGHQFIDRGAVAKYILGERYAERAAKQGKQQRTRAEGETRRQTVRNPSSTAGQHSEPRRRGTARTFAEKSVEEMERELSEIPVRSS